MDHKAVVRTEMAGRTSCVKTMVSSTYPVAFPVSQPCDRRPHRAGDSGG